ncbi:MAG TPA: hypothetical protein VGU90_09210, partial [Terriglobales bacterium]|nr:hypothetical protein [Terriglobales bacterium]
VDKCAKCGSTSVVQRAMMVDKLMSGGGAGAERTLNVRVDADPNAMVFKRSTRSVVHAWICGQCGYMELYADTPGELYQAFTAAQSALTDLK